MSCNCLKPGRGVKDFVSLNYFVMHFFISTHLQVNPSILNVLLIMIKSQSMTVINAIIFFYRLTALIYIYIYIYIYTHTHTVGTESIQTPLNVSLFVILQPFSKII